jgi:hypothetical protein
MSKRSSSERDLVEMVRDLFGAPLIECFGTPVDNSIVRVGLEDEREDADLEVHDDVPWHKGTDL